MLYQLIVGISLALFVTNLILNLRNLRTPPRNARVPEPAPLISVLIPARDEEANIETCLASLEKQDYPNFEVLVLDDDSSDRTADIVRRMAAADSRISLIRGQPLPPDWAGKPYACHQLASRARGSWLLFVDADTIHAPHMLRSVLSLALELKLSLLSGFPRQLSTSLPQKIATPVWYFIILSWLPIWWLQRSKQPRTSLAIGQFLLFPAQEYWRIGGHKAVKSRILEDICLGVEVNRRRGRHVVVDLSPVVSCHMYRSIAATWQGLARSIHAIAALSLPALLGLIVAGYAFFLAPFYWLWNELFGPGAAGGWQPIMIFQVAAIFAMRWLVDSRFKGSLLSTVLHPLGISFLIVVALYAGSRQVIGAGVQWKRRLYPRESGVE